MLSRKEERSYIFQLLFTSEFHKETVPSKLYRKELTVWEIEDTEYIRDTFFGVFEKQEEIDTLINKYAQKWNVARMSVATRSVLRLAVYEMLFGEISVPVAINEAVNIAKEYDAENAPKFVNAILDNLAKGENLTADKKEEQK